MTEQVMCALKAAVNVARNHNISHLKALREILIDDGHDPSDVEEALRMWANYEQAKRFA